MLQSYFQPFRKQIVGIDQTFESPYGTQKIVYADWTASGRLYAPIERLLSEQIGPYVGNTHTETTITGSAMTHAYHQALMNIKEHVNAAADDIIISSGSGMTGVINKFQRILGLKVHERHQQYTELPEELKPIIFVTHMEHHSNQTSWLETTGEVEIIQSDSKGKVDLAHLQQLLYTHADRKIKIAAITSCSNVSGVMTPYHEVAALMHQHGGLCFVDFACSAPYINIDMHPADKDQALDAIYFSPHKFLGGPGSTGILVFDSKLYQNSIPDHPGGGTVTWTNPWGQHKYLDDIQAREDGGTPAFIQTIRAALSVRLKEEMGVENMLKREEEILARVWDKISPLKNLHVLADNIRDRLGVVSFYIEDLHYNLAVRLLNDRYGIQIRGGCSCAGTYGHYLLQLSQQQSSSIFESVSCGDQSLRPGWCRMSIHPTMMDEEVDFICDALADLCEHHQLWAQDYRYDNASNEYKHISKADDLEQMVDGWLTHSLKPHRDAVS